MNLENDSESNQANLTETMECTESLVGTEFKTDPVSSQSGQVSSTSNSMREIQSNKAVSGQSSCSPVSNSDTKLGQKNSCDQMVGNTDAQTANQHALNNNSIKGTSNEQNINSVDSKFIDDLNMIPIPVREATENIQTYKESVGNGGKCTINNDTIGDIEGSKVDGGQTEMTSGSKMASPSEVSDHPLSVEITPGGISDNSVLSPSGISAGSPHSVTGTPPASPKIASPVENVITRQPTERDGKVKSKRRGTAWNDDQTDFLMEIWARHVDNTQSDEFSHNAPVYRLIAAAMVEHGMDKSWEQCKTRIHTLKRAYKLTKDEVNAGSPSITYCRHFESLKIIMGDHPTTTPKVLADTLAVKRQQREANRATIQQEIPKRKLPPVNKLVKKVNTGVQQSTDSSVLTPLAPKISTQNVTSVVTNNNTSCYNTHTVQMQTVASPLPTLPSLTLPKTGTPQPQKQQQQVTASLPPFQLSTQPAPLYRPPPPYQAPSSTVAMQATKRALTSVSTEINNNDVDVKQEKPDSSTEFQPMQQTPGVFPTWSTYTTIHNSQQHTQLQQQQQSTDDLERMRIDLEMKKIEVERNKIEMEERQRREERDHQYRMMQLLLFGLGQQSSTHACTGQNSDDVTQAPTSKTLTRAIENGLVPGGSLTVNEKGLSFSEI